MQPAQQKENHIYCFWEEGLSDANKTSYRPAPKHWIRLVSFNLLIDAFSIDFDKSARQLMFLKFYFAQK